ncbi:J domain-containing protein [Pseudahrensia aquimaris]|uniref:J domain-containing protein n=1 Tax=Pseudahrensia aquimaris TaxID=744461 RepID=A0ABW3FCS4_9HYPH
MASNSDIFDKIRIKPRGAKKREEEEKAANECAWEGCDKPGAHKAPMGRNREGHYINFCLEHVRLYNKNFNYFSGLSDEQIAKFQKESLTGNRPTKPMSTRRVGEQVDESTLRAKPTWHKNVRTRYTPDGKRIPTGTTGPRKLKRLDAKAMRDLGLPESASKEEVTRKYKLLVKQNHPDANGGDRSSEQRLQVILAAYKQLKSSGIA